MVDPTIKRDYLMKKTFRQIHTVLNQIQMQHQDVISLSLKIVASVEKFLYCMPTQQGVDALECLLAFVHDCLSQ